MKKPHRTRPTKTARDLRTDELKSIVGGVDAPTTAAPQLVSNFN